MRFARIALAVGLFLPPRSAQAAPCDFVGIAASPAHALAVRADGTVWAWGNGYRGSLGNAGRRDVATPVQVRGIASAVSVAGGHYSSLALLADGTLRAWGQGSRGRLGNGASDDTSVPVAVSLIDDGIAIAAYYTHALGARADGSAWSWGANSWGQLGDGSRTDASVPVQVVGLTEVVAVAAGVPVDGRFVRPSEKEVLPPERYIAELLFDLVVVKQQPSVLEEPVERVPLILGVLAVTVLKADRRAAQLSSAPLLRAAA